MTKVFKLKNDMVSEIMKGVFDIAEKLCFLQNETFFRSKKSRATKYGIEIPSYFGSKLWTSVPNDYENFTSLEDFKAKIETLVAESTQ